jgi:RNA polymerase sigma factor (sigma-70 family)
MLEDELLKMGFILGSPAALARIYRKYADMLKTLAMVLLNDASAAEDVVHDVFVRFAQSSRRFRLHGNLKSYLSTCVANQARDCVRMQLRRTGTDLDNLVQISAPDTEPLETVIADELSLQAQAALLTLPYEQREVIVLYAKSDMPFKQIAKLQDVPARTVQSRYRYGMEKLRKVLAQEDSL